MAYIFDSFPDSRSALGFAAAATSVSLDSNAVQYFTTADLANEHDPFPGDLVPPIVHVERADGDPFEEHLSAVAAMFGGRYVGT